jgi:hypothetical protein
MENDPLITVFKMFTAVNDNPNDHRHSFMGSMIAFPISAQTVDCMSARKPDVPK